MIPLAVTLSSGLNNGSGLNSEYKKEKIEDYFKKVSEREAFERRNYLDSITPAPKYRTNGGNCSAYVRSVGKDFYDKDYFYADAWDRKHLDKVIHSFSKEENAYDKFEDLESEGVLEKGMVLGIYHRPPRNNERDIYGRKADYSHVAIFRGIDAKTGKYIFDHEWGHKQDTISLSSMERKGWKLKDLIDHNPISYAEAIGKSDYSNSEDS
jgi:hypothetical protein